MAVVGLYGPFPATGVSGGDRNASVEGRENASSASRSLTNSRSGPAMAWNHATIALPSALTAGRGAFEKKNGWDRTDDSSAKTSSGASTREALASATPKCSPVHWFHTITT
jgi:hypothetical protein